MVWQIRDGEHLRAGEPPAGPWTRGTEGLGGAKHKRLHGDNELTAITSEAHFQQQSSRVDFQPGHLEHGAFRFSRMKQAAKSVRLISSNLVRNHGPIIFG